MTRVGFIGLGEQGKPLAINVAKGGFDLMVNDLRREPVDELVASGARAARSAREVGAHGEIIEVIVVNDAQVEAVVLSEDGVLAGARPGSVIAVHSTVRPATVRKIGERAAAKSVAVIDAAVSGGARGAQMRTMCYMVGGEKDALERCRPVFATSAGTIVHMGALGAGMAAKLAHQVVLCVNMLAAHEGTELARRAGLDPAALSEAIHAGAAQSRIADRWARGRPTAQSGVLFDKDLSLALELAHEVGAAMPAAALTQRLLRQMLGGPGDKGPGRGGGTA
jgi:3-hydroxyisobutyrate dehydrogenase-like beta-hydroxyacid dehydrogenase